MQNLTAAQSLILADFQEGDEEFDSLPDLYSHMLNLFVLPGEKPAPGGVVITEDDGTMDTQDVALSDAYCEVLREARVWQANQ